MDCGKKLALVNSVVQGVVGSVKRGDITSEKAEKRAIKSLLRAFLGRPVKDGEVELARADVFPTEMTEKCCHK